MIKHLIVMDVDTFNDIKTDLNNMRYILGSLDSCYAVSELERFLDRLKKDLEGVECQ